MRYSAIKRAISTEFEGSESCEAVFESSGKKKDAIATNAPISLLLQSTLEQFRSVERYRHLLRISTIGAIEFSSGLKSYAYSYSRTLSDLHWVKPRRLQIRFGLKF